MSRLKTNSSDLSFEKIWLLFQETTIKFQESERLLTEKFSETDRQMKETDMKLNKLYATVSGIGQNNGAMAEEFFLNGLKARSEIFGIPFEHVDRFERHTKKLSGEYDIVLFNGTKIIVVEVKYKLHPSDISEFCERKLKIFKTLFPEFKNKQVIGCMAAMAIPKIVKEEVFNAGLLLLTPSGDNIKVANNKQFKPIVY